MPGKPSVSTSGRMKGWLSSLVEWVLPSRPRTPRRSPEESSGSAEDSAGRQAAGTLLEDSASGPGSRDEPPAHRATMQLLPGRLEPVNTEVVQQEVRFPRNSGGEHVFTIGWEVGDPTRHVTLDHPSIRAIHARMTFSKGSWMIESASPGDPIAVNGTPVPQSRGPYLLANGDEVRIGQALFRFLMP